MKIPDYFSLCLSNPSKFFSGPLNFERSRVTCKHCTSITIKFMRVMQSTSSKKILEIFQTGARGRCAGDGSAFVYINHDNKEIDKNEDNGGYDVRLLQTDKRF